MKESEVQEARLKHAAGVLHHEIARLAQGRQLNRYTVERIGEWIEIHRKDCKRMGIDFPEMIVLAFPSIGAIEMCRKDWTQPDIETFICDLPGKHPGLTGAEIAKAVKQAWPDYRPRGMELLAARVQGGRQ